MKKLLLAIAVITCAAALTANAQEAPKKKTLTDDQKKLQKEMVAKYDTNKDGKLDKEEKAKISADDKKKMEDAGLTKAKKAAK